MKTSIERINPQKILITGIILFLILPLCKAILITPTVFAQASYPYYDQNRMGSYPTTEQQIQSMKGQIKQYEGIIGQQQYMQGVQQQRIMKLEKRIQELEMQKYRETIQQINKEIQTEEEAYLQLGRKDGKKHAERVDRLEKLLWDVKGKMPPPTEEELKNELLEAKEIYRKRATPQRKQRIEDLEDELWNLRDNYKKQVIPERQQRFPERRWKRKITQ